MRLGLLYRTLMKDRMARKYCDSKGGVSMSDEGNKITRSQIVMYVQQLSYLPFNSLDALERRLKELKKDKGLIKWAYIVHDKDQKDGRTIEKHIHLDLRFKTRISVKSIAKMLDDEEERIEVFTKRGQSLEQSWINALSYLIHRTTKSKDKYPYDLNEVKANFNYAKVIKDAEKSIVGANKIVDQFLREEIDYDTAEMLLSNYGAKVLSKNIKILDDAQNFLNKKHYKKWVKDKKKTNQSIIVVWIWGEAGTGKTSFCKDFMDKRNIEYYEASGHNDPFQNYAGESGLILDELRPRNYITYSDLLKILDPFDYDKTAVARYHNKYLMCDYIFVTSPFSPYSFYKNAQVKDTNDSLEQLHRRISILLHFTPKYVTEERVEGNNYKEVSRIKNVWSQEARGKQKNKLSLTDLTNLKGE